MVLLNLDIHNFFKENNLGISKQNITEDIFKFIQPKVPEFEDVDLSMLFNNLFTCIKQNGNLLSILSKVLKRSL